jgi:hypothetical protein
MKRELELMPTINDAVAIGTKNAASLILATLFYVLTIWIPYLNVGTTIAMATIPGKLAKGEIINPTFIFDSVYRRRMGSYFLLTGFIKMIQTPAFLFLIVPAIVLALMYSLALYIMIDKDTTPTQALELSNKATYGFKTKICLVVFVFYLLCAVVGSIVLGIINLLGSTFLLILFVIALGVLAGSCKLSLNAVIYRNVFLNAQEESESTATE